jgi:hypothetical protein
MQQQDAVYLGYLWRALEDYAVEGMRYRVILQNVTNARIAKPTVRSSSYYY